jgi:electron transfer flavoprotein alpha/beta subunit
VKILVQVKCEFDSTLNLRVDRTKGEAVSESGDRLTRVARIGRLGLELALSLKNDAEITAFALGSGHMAALRHALAAGARRAIELGGDLPSVGRPLPAAFIRWLTLENPQLVIADREISIAAGFFSWSYLKDVTSMELLEDVLLVERALGRGNRERIETTLPAILQPELSRQPRYVARARCHAASQLAIFVERLEDPAEGAQIAFDEGTIQETRARTRQSAGLPPKTAARPLKASDRLQLLMGQGLAKKEAVATPPSESVSQDPEALAESFVRYLAHHQLLKERDHHG